MEDIADRITQLIKYLMISKNAFAERIGISSSLISQITTKKNNFRADILQKITYEFPLLNTVWLLNGIGEMWLENIPIEQRLKASGYNDEQISGVINNSPGNQKQANAVKKDMESFVDVRHSRKLYDILEKKHPDLYKLKINFDSLLSFHEALSAIDNEIGDKLRNVFWTFPGTFNFKEYEQRAVDTLETLRPYEKSISEMAKAISKFYNSIKLVPGNKIDFDEYIV